MGAEQQILIRINPYRSSEDLQFPIGDLIDKVQNTVRGCKENRIISMKGGAFLMEKYQVFFRYSLIIQITSYTKTIRCSHCG